MVGGGVSGIAAAHWLRQAGWSPEILERDARIGGRIGLSTLDGHPIELGGKNIGRRYTLFRAFAEATGGAAWDPMGVNTARVQDGRLRTLDGERRIRSFLAQLSRRAPRDLLRFACLAARVRWDEREAFLGGARFRRLADRTGDPVVSDWFGDAFCRDAWRPMSLLMNAAEPDEVHVGNLGTNVAMALDDYEQVSGGLGTLLERFAAQVPVRLSTPVQALHVEGGQVVGLALGDGRVERYDQVFLALPAPAAAALVAPHLPALAAELGGIRYFPTAVVVAAYDRDVFRPEVRALRFDPPEALAGARAYGKGKLNIVRYTFAGCAARPLLDGALDADALLDRAEGALGRIFPLPGAARAAIAPPRALALCAYSAHHAARLDRIDAAQRLPGLHLTGDWLRGASIEACFRAARDTVARAVTPLARSPR